MRNADIARVFDEIADFLELRDDNPFRINAYRNAAREVGSTGYDLPAMLAAGEALPRMPGIGPDLTAKIHEIARTGSCQMLEKLRKDYPPGITGLLRLPGVGPKRVRRFYEELKIGSLEELEQAARSGRLRGLAGFGAKSEQKLLEAIEAVRLRNAKRS